MASSFEKSVKGATKVKAAPPKTKYIEHILVATHSGEHGVAEVFRALVLRLREPTWTVVLKGLITVHLMIREGSPDATLSYLAKHKNILAINTFTDAQLQGRTIRHYANYLSERAHAYKDTKTDWVRTKESRLEKLPVEKGLLRETEVVQYQLTALLKCDVMDHDPDNEITITVFRLLVLDLLALFQVLNQAMINILGHFFEMSKTDAERAMEIYRNFTRQTDYVVQYLSIARQYEHLTRVEVPKLKHAPVNLGRQLDEYLKDPDFEIHRRQFIAELDAKKRGVSKSAFKSESSKASSSKPASSSTPQPAKPAEPAKGPEQDLIDLFDSIEDKQTTMVIHPTGQVMPLASNSPFQQPPLAAAIPNNGFIAQPAELPGFQVPNMVPFAQQPGPQQPLQPTYTGAGFGGFTPQPQPSFSPSPLAPIPQESAVSSFQSPPTGLTVPQFATIQQPMQTGSTNPFRQSMLMAQQTVTTSLPAAQPQVPAPVGKSTNPFARSSPQQAQPFIAPAPTNTLPFSQAPPQGLISVQPTAPVQLQTSPLQSMQTGTNPFAKGFGGSAISPVAPAQRPTTLGAAAPSQVPQATGTNPFRQGAFVNHNTGMGWQHGQNAIGGGLDGLETVPVFPRPTAQTPWQEQ